MVFFSIITYCALLSFPFNFSRKSLAKHDFFLIHCYIGFLKLKHLMLCCQNLLWIKLFVLEYNLHQIFWLLIMNPDLMLESIVILLFYILYITCYIIYTLFSCSKVIWHVWLMFILELQLIVHSTLLSRV